MAKEDIFGGLKTAISRGFSLKDAMISFYNAGYKKEEIEEAARDLQYQMIENRQKSGNERLWTEEPKGAGVPTSPKQAQQMEVPEPPTQIVKPKPEVTPKPQAAIKPSPVEQKPEILNVPKFKPLPKPEEEAVKEEPKVQQKPQVSSYESAPPKKVRTITVVLIGILIVLVGLLGAIFLFKDQIINFFNGLF